MHKHYWPIPEPNNGIHKSSRLPNQKGIKDIHTNKMKQPTYHVRTKSTKVVHPKCESKKKHTRKWNGVHIGLPCPFFFLFTSRWPNAVSFCWSIDKARKRRVDVRVDPFHQQKVKVYEEQTVSNQSGSLGFQHGLGNELNKMLFFFFQNIQKKNTTIQISKRTKRNDTVVFFASTLNCTIFRSMKILSLSVNDNKRFWCSLVSAVWNWVFGPIVLKPRIIPL